MFWAIFQYLSTTYFVADTTPNNGITQLCYYKILSNEIQYENLSQCLDTRCSTGDFMSCYRPVRIVLPGSFSSMTLATVVFLRTSHSIKLRSNLFKTRTLSYHLVKCTVTGMLP